MNNKYVSVIVTGVIVCVIFGIFGWITVTGASTERYLQMLIFLAPTLASLLGIQVGVKTQQTATETKAIVSPSNGEYVARARDAYTAYGGVVGWKSFQGDALPKFDELSDEQKRGWYAAARTANGDFTG